MVAWSMAVIGAILVTLGFLVYTSTTASLMRSVDSALLTTSSATQIELGESDERGEAVVYRAATFYLIVRSDGTAVSNPYQLDLSTLPADVWSGALPRFGSMSMSGDPVRTYAREIDNVAGDQQILIVGQSIRSEEAARQQLVMILLFGGVLGLVLSFVGGWFLAGRALVPVRRAFQRQQEFVADASHELRTPLTILHSSVDLLHQGGAESSGDTTVLVDEMRQEIVRMERLTRDLLTLARLDRGELQLASGRVELGALAGDLKRRTALLADARGIEVDVQVEGGSIVVEGDPDRLQEVGLIVLDNALKHSANGGAIRISVRQQDEAGILQVDDDGEGIPPEHLARVFERFHRVDASRSRKTGGVGLGLAIARGLVAAHGGQIRIENRAGGGARVTIRIPLAVRIPARSV